MDSARSGCAIKTRPRACRCESALDLKNRKPGRRSHELCPIGPALCQPRPVVAHRRIGQSWIRPADCPGYGGIELLKTLPDRSKQFAAGTRQADMACRAIR